MADAVDEAGAADLEMIAERHPERTIFTRFIPPAEPDDLARLLAPLLRALAAVDAIASRPGVP